MAEAISKIEDTLQQTTMSLLWLAGGADAAPTGCLLANQYFQAHFFICRSSEKSCRSMETELIIR